MLKYTVLIFRSPLFFIHSLDKETGLQHLACKNKLLYIMYIQAKRKNISIFNYTTVSCRRNPGFFPELLLIHEGLLVWVAVSR